MYQYDSNTYRKSKNKPVNDQTTLQSPIKVQADYQVKNECTYSGNDHRKQSPQRSYIDDYENDRFKTITLNSARKSFKNNYLNHTNTDKTHQPSWFVDVVPSSNNNEQFTTRRKYSISNDEEKPLKSSLRRKETFKVEKEPSSLSRDLELSNNRTSLNRKHTFRIETPSEDRETTSSSQSITYSPDKSSISRRSRRTLEPIRVEIQSSISERTGKSIPVGVTAPYRRLPNDTTDNSSLTNKNQYPSQSSKVSEKVSSYNALNDIRENLAQLGRRQRYQSPSRHTSSAAATQTDYYQRSINNNNRSNITDQSTSDPQKYITRFNVNNYLSGKGREINVVEPRGRSVAVGPRLRTAERSVSRDRRYNSSPIRQYDVKVVTNSGSLSYSSMKDRPLVRILKPVTKPTDWTYNQVYL